MRYMPKKAQSESLDPLMNRTSRAHSDGLVISATHNVRSC